MSTYILRRLLQSIPVIVGVVTLTFLLIHLIPGDPIDLMLGESAQNMDKENLREKLGLNLPLWQQYFMFWGNLLDGTWGESLYHGRSVSSLILEKFGPTLWLSLTSMFLASVIAIPLGVIAARMAGSIVDTVSVFIALLGMSIPIFVMAPILVIMFSVNIRMLPPSGYGGIEYYILPVFCLGTSLSGILVRMVRTSVLECLGEDYVRTAKAKGLRPQVVLFKHTLKNALIPVITIFGNMLGGLLAGAVITETIFDWPGIGKLFFDAFSGRDYPLVQGVVLWIAISYVLINLVVDLLYSVVDPRVRYD